MVCGLGKERGERSGVDCDGDGDFVADGVANFDEDDDSDGDGDEDDVDGYEDDNAGDGDGG